MLKILFLVLLASVSFAEDFTPQNLVGTYKAEYSSSYLAEIQFLQNGNLKYRESIQTPIGKGRMPKPGCLGSWKFDGDRVLTQMDCSKMGGPKKIWHTWYFNGSQYEETLQEPGAIFVLQSSLFPNRIFNFRFVRVNGAN